MKRIIAIIICIITGMALYAQPHPSAEQAQALAESIAADPALANAVISITYVLIHKTL